MDFLNIKTVMFSCLIIQALCMAVIWALWRENRQRYSGMSFWLASYAIQLAGLLLILLRGNIPPLLSVGLSHLALVIGIMLLKHGFWLFLGKKGKDSFDWALLTVFVLAQVYFYNFHSGLNAWNLNLNTALLLLSLEGLWSLLKGTAAPLRRTVLPAASAFAALAALSALRIAYSLYSPLDLFAANSVHTLLLLGYVVLILGLTFSLLLMVNRRLLEDAKADFSLRVKAEENLGASEERFQKAFLAAPMLMSLSEVTSGRYIEVNDKFCEVTGFTREEVIGKSSTEIGWINKEARDRLIRESNGQSARVPEIELYAKGGRKVICYYACELVRFGDQNLMLAIAEDLTESKKAQEAIKESEYRFKLVVESAPEAIFVQSGGKFVYLNPACCALFGVAGPKELIGTDFMDRMAPEFREDIRKRIKYQADTGKPTPLMEQKFLRADGSRIDVETTAVPVKFTGRDSYLVFIRNITERKRAEAELLRAQKMESVGGLAGGIAHDFNNLLAGISGNLALIQAAAGTEGELSAMAREADAACLAAKSLARQLLTVSSSIEPVKELLDLGTLVPEIVSFALRGLNARKTVKVGDGPLLANADKDQLLQVIQNLVINADQAMPGGGTISVNLAPVELRVNEIPPLGPGRYARIEVRDTGAGVPPEMLQRIFDPYFSTKGKGRGLGLALCRAIITKHDGQIDVASEPGKGSVFTIHLPLAETA